jgi:hypothetical protein
MFVADNSSSAGRTYSTFYDVGKDVHTYFYRGASAYDYSTGTGGKYITATTTSVTVTNPITSAVRSHVVIYY